MSRIPLAGRTLVLAALALSLAACDSTDDDWPFPGAEVDAEAGVEVTDAAALAGLRAAWVADRPDGYWLRYEVVCFCAPTVVDVRVVGDQILETRLNGEVAPPERSLVVPLRVTDLYDQAIASLDEAAFTEVRVRPGAPPLLVSLSIDGAFEIADDEVTYRVTAYAPLEVRAY
ncbi:DUF6174 domain-containing protein [Rubrivirga sp. IMCC43871]|uniref:DUF6174 domain-containing protein n=1 Tax=Rubrivirga sp. IMCC43871 TaxID=3391575 RepID=UPI00398FE784